jgi:predicted nucleic acid-binding Zn ribbon protein
MRRVAPRPLSAALAGAVEPARPAGLLAAVQSAWPQVAGDALARAASPVSERAGTVTVTCESGVWAQELELLAPDLVERLNARLDTPLGEGSGPPAGPGRVERLRFVVGSVPNR